jgi:hypothetical protein
MGFLDFFKSPAAYLIMGHGGDSGEWENRPIVPEGYTIVTNATCGLSIMNTNYRAKLEKIQKLAENTYTKPANHKSNLNSKIGDLHIFTPGMKMPDITVEFGEHFQGVNPLLSIKPSGVFKIPTKNLDFKSQSIHKDTINPSTIKSIFDSIFFHEENQFKYPKDFLNTIQTEISKFKEGDDVKTLFSKISLRYTLEDLIKILPKGVYYFFGCREFIGENKKKIGITRNASFRQQGNLTRKVSNVSSRTASNVSSVEYNSGNNRTKPVNPLLAFGSPNPLKRGSLKRGGRRSRRNHK